jgi:hypothetical protein
MSVAEAWELSVNHDEIPRGTLYLLILKNFALHREVQGCKTADSIQNAFEMCSRGRTHPSEQLLGSFKQLEETSR